MSPPDAGRNPQLRRPNYWRKNPENMNNTPYQPPYTITPEILNRVAVEQQAAALHDQLKNILAEVLLR